MNGQFHIETVSSLRALEEGHEVFSDESYWLAAARPLVMEVIEPIDPSVHCGEMAPEDSCPV